MQNIIFKRTGYREQFENLLDPRLMGFMFWLAYYIDCKFRKDITITCVNRTVDENKAVNGSEDSSHLIGEAVDMRSWSFTQREIDQIIKVARDCWGDLIYIIYHDSGNGKHIHISIAKKYHRRNYVKE